MEISWYVVSFNSVYLSFLEVYKLLLILSQGCKLEPSLYQFSVGPHPPFRVSFWCVCVCAWKGKHACSIASWHPHKITDVQLPYTICIDVWWYTQWSCRWQRYPWEVPASISRALQTWRRKPTSRTSDSRPCLVIFWRIFGFWNCHMKKGQTMA